MTPIGWKVVKLEDIAELNPRSIPVPINHEVSFIPMACVEEETGRVDLSVTRQYDEVRKGYTPFIDGDIIFAKITPCMENGKIAILEGLKNGIGFGSTEFHVIRTRSNVSRRFIFYYLANKDFRKEAQRRMRGSAGQQRVPLDFLSQRPMMLPPLEQQHKIASILSQVDDLIQKTDEIIEQTQRLKRGLMQRLLTKGLGHTKFKKAVLFPKYLSTTIPEEWALTSLSSVTSKIADRDHRTPVYLEKGIPMISPTNIDDDMNLTFRDIKYVSKEEYERNCKKTDIRPGDIIFSRIGAGLGKSFIVKEDFYEFSILHSLCQIRANELIASEFLLWFLRSELIQKRIWVTVQSMGVPDLGLNAIGHLPIFLPSMEEQQEIASILSNIKSMINAHKVYRSHLETLKRGLIQKLLTGQIRVKV